MPTNDTQQTSAELLQAALESERIKSERLRQANEALVQEFSKADTYEEQLDIAKQAIKKILPQAVETLQELIVNAESEAVRGNLSKYVVDSVLNGKLDRNADGEMAGLLKRLADEGHNIPEQVVAAQQQEAESEKQ